MAGAPDRERILVVGSDASVRRVGIPPGSECEVELVDSLEEAAARHATGNYARIVVDPAALKGVSFEVLAPVRDTPPVTAEPASPLPHASRTVPEPTPEPDEPSAPPRVSEDRGLALAVDSALRESEERYRTIFETAPAGIVTVDLAEMRILTSNSAFQQMLGYRGDELLGKSIAEISHPDDMERDREATRSMLGGGSDHFHVEKRYLRKDGQVVWGHLTRSVVRGPDGEPLYGIGLVQDITERKQLEHYREDLLRRERRIAETLQEAIVPAEVVSRKGDYTFCVVYEPAYREAEIGGDFYDIFDLGDSKVGVLIGDVAGKGLAAAVHVAAVRYAVRGYAYLDPRPGVVLTRANEVICRDCAGESRTLTAFFAVVDTRLRTMVYGSAGHEPPIAIDRDGRCIELASTGTLLGMLPGAQYAEESLRLDEMERIVMLTDGITEARRSGGELFAEGGLTDYLLRNRTVPGPVVAVGLVAAAMEHAGGPLRDDAAVVVLERADHAPA